MDIGVREDVSQVITETIANMMAVASPHVRIQVTVTCHQALLIISVGVALAGADLTAQKLEIIVLSRLTSVEMEAPAMITRSMDCVVIVHQAFMEHSASWRLLGLGVAAILISTMKGLQLLRIQPHQTIVQKKLFTLRKKRLSLCHMGGAA
jgi:hypothetical protein